MPRSLFVNRHDSHLFKVRGSSSNDKQSDTNLDDLLKLLDVSEPSTLKLNPHDNPKVFTNNTESNLENTKSEYRIIERYHYKSSIIMDTKTVHPIFTSFECALFYFCGEIIPYMCKDNEIPLCFHEGAQYMNRSLVLYNKTYSHSECIFESRTMPGKPDNLYVVWKLTKDGIAHQLPVDDPQDAAPSVDFRRKLILFALEVNKFARENMNISQTSFDNVRTIKEKRQMCPQLFISSTNPADDYTCVVRFTIFE